MYVPPRACHTVPDEGGHDVLRYCSEHFVPSLAKHVSVEQTAKRPPLNCQSDCLQTKPGTAVCAGKIMEDRPLVSSPHGSVYDENVSLRLAMTRARFALHVFFQQEIKGKTE